MKTKIISYLKMVWLVVAFYVLVVGLMFVGIQALTAYVGLPFIMIAGNTGYAFDIPKWQGILFMVIFFYVGIGLVLYAGSEVRKAYKRAKEKKVAPAGEEARFD